MKNYSEDTSRQYHIQAGKGEVGRYVILPGDPKRCQKIAEYFDDPVFVADNREYVTYTGTLDGVKVSVTSTGIGGPSTAIAVEELYQCGADTMLRVGTCASTSRKVSLGDVVIPNGAARMEGVSTHYLPIEFPAVPDFQVVKAAQQAAQKLGLPYNIGVTITKASFYTQTAPETKPVGPELIYRWEAYEKGGATSTSMECSVLFTVGASLGIRTGCVMASATNCKDYSENGRKSDIDIEDRAIRTAIETMRMLIAKDKENA